MAEMPDPTSAIALSLSSLKRVGITLSQQQMAAILCVVNGKDTIVSLPTGHGKSVIFKVVPWCHEMLVKGLGEEDKEAAWFICSLRPRTQCAPCLVEVSLFGAGEAVEGLRWWIRGLIGIRQCLPSVNK